MTLAVLVGGCLLTACGDDSADTKAPATTAPLTDPATTTGGTGSCSLLTTEEVSTAMGKPVSDVAEDASGSVTTCTWTSTAPPADPTAASAPTLMIAVLPLTAADQAVFDELTANVPPHRLVDGLGDFAILKCGFTTVDTCPWYSEIFVVKGDRYLQVDLSNFSSPGDFEDGATEGIVTAIAELVTPRL
jgi:hypothetical protein